jgi:hypothetical protein
MKHTSFKNKQWLYSIWQFGVNGIAEYGYSIKIRLSSFPPFCGCVHAPLHNSFPYIRWDKSSFPDLCRRLGYAKTQKKEKVVKKKKPA